MSKEVQVKDWGLINYQTAWEQQTILFKEVIDRKVRNRKLSQEEQLKQFHYYIFCEHPHVYTLGRSGSEDNLLLDQGGLAEKEAEYIKINRGGDITYHGPGQIVGYPILDMDEFFTDIARYIRFIEEMVIRTLGEYGLEGGRIAGLSGVWLDKDTPQARKICAVGVHLSRWTTMHGFAFNINTNLDYFKYIVPCGIADQDKDVTSLQKELGREVSLTEIKGKLLKHFKDLFEAELLF
ncbi:MAG: lipoyl(octanoyl) transferase LipB [Saprospiraceae bacterium]|nr:lipoyl(octanoyl) transferase LipB [Saprospiraceae bacterium]